VQVKIGPYLYPVSFNKDEINAESVAFNSDLAGVILYRDQRILIDPANSIHRQRVVLTHEILHGIFYAAGNENQGKKTEALITQLAPILAQFIQDNPDVLDFIRGKEG
jgi:hypothetical protein